MLKKLSNAGEAFVHELLAASAARHGAHVYRKVRIADVWEIPNVNSRHVEKTTHPCQFPVALAKRLVDALTPDTGLVLDPFAGSATSGVAAILSGRRFVSSEIYEPYVDVARTRLLEALNGNAKYRSEHLPVRQPQAGGAVATRPEHFSVHKRT